MNIRQFTVLHHLKAVRSPDDDTEIIPGRIGKSHIFAYDEERLGVMIVPESGSSNHWTAARKAFEHASMMITQNGHEEGSAVFDPNNREQLKLALKYAGVRQRRGSSPTQAAVIAEAREVRARNRTQKSSVQEASFDHRGTHVGYKLSKRIGVLFIFVLIQPVV